MDLGGGSPKARILLQKNFVKPLVVSNENG